ncbi:MAG: thiamine pyrophosphate-binding protein [Segniliparus sp.]|uniref:thiamine pyrophosphate-binding protein n=1 Tax=Segniliparus sp. TaxID=2804064 RepID=UPI003F2ACE43
MAGSPPRAARKAVVEQLVAEGVEHVFGNPGTIEQGLIDEIEQSSLDYVLALQEAAAVGMADGYARASGRLGVVQLHSGVGLGNGVGMLYQAMRGGSPLLVLVGEAGLQYDAFDAQMAADLAGMARPVCKNVFRVLHPASTLRILRRAAQTALTPPQGPVLVVLPADVLDQETDEEATATALPVTKVAPNDAVFAEAVGLLRSPGRRVIVMGDGVAQSGGQHELARVAAALDADVYGANDSEVNIDFMDPHYRGPLGHMFGEVSAGLLKDAASVLVVGTYVFPEVYPSLVSPFAPDAKIVHIDLDVRSIGKNHPITLGVLGDPKLCLGKIASMLEKFGQPASKGERPSALPDLATDSPLEALVRSIAERSPDSVVFDEALTCSPTLLRYIRPRRRGAYLATRGGSLGVGIPGAVGAKLARPERQVVAFTGDGGAMYTPQALWTARRHGIAAKFVVCNNHRYQLLDNNIEEYWRTQDIPEHEHPKSFDLSPSVDFVGLARSMGVPAELVDNQESADQAARRMLEHEGPYLVEALV